MFSGIISAVSKIKNSRVKDDSLFLTIEKPAGWRIMPGDSLNTNGVCLTVKEISKTDYTTELMTETLKKTTFGKEIPKFVNLEGSLRLSDLLDGHLVLGHVDTIGRIEEIISSSRSKVYKFSFSEKFSQLVAEKGSIAIDGISLTVVEVGRNWLTVSLVDYTIKHTTLGTKKKNDLVNLEFDILAKYLQRLLRSLD